MNNYVILTVKHSFVWLPDNNSSGGTDYPRKAELTEMQKIVINNQWNSMFSDTEVSLTI